MKVERGTVRKRQEINREGWEQEREHRFKIHYVRV